MGGSIFDVQSHDKNSNTLAEQRLALLNWLLWTVVVVGLPMLAIGIFDEVNGYLRLGAVVTYVIAYSALVVAAAWKRLGQVCRGVMFLLALYLVGVTSLRLTGLSSPTSLYLFAVVVFAGLFFGLRVGLVAFVASTIALGLAAWFCVSGIWIVGSLSNAQALAWATSLVAFTCTSAAALVSSTLLLRGLERSIVSTRMLAEDLRKEAEDLSRAERRLLLKDIVFNSSLAANSIADIDGRITDANAAFLRLWGYSSREEVVGKAISAFLVDLDTAMAIMNALNTVGAWEGDYTAKRADGSVFTAHSVATSLKDSSGAIVGYQSSVLDITERRQMEDALRRSERQARAIFEQQHQLCGMLTVEGVVIEANHTALELAGVQKADVVGRPFVDTPWWAHSPEERQRLNDAIAEVRTGRTVMFDTTHMGPDGRMHYLAFSLRPVFDDSGAVAFMVAESHDITERKRMEEALRESETKYRRLIETTSTGYVILNVAGQVLDANLEYVRLTGHERLEQILNRCVTEWTATYDLQRNAEEVRKCVERGSVVGLEIDYVHSNGTIVPVEISASTLGSGSDLTIVTLCRNIGDRKRIEDELRKSERSYREIFNATNECIFIHDCDTGAIVDVNQRTVDTYGYTREEFRTMTVGEVSSGEPPHSHEHALEWIRKAVNEGPQIFEWRTKFRDGRQWWVEVSLRKSEIGGRPCVLAVARDISERKRMTAELEQLAAVIRYSQELVSLATPDGQMIFLNEAGACILGIRPERVGDYDIMQVIPQHLKTKTEHEILPVLRAGGVWTGEFQYVNLETGHLTDVHAMTFAINDLTTGVPQYLANVSIDISDRKRAEAAMRLDEERLQALLELNLMMGESESVMTHFALEAAVRLTNSTIGYIAFANEDESVLAIYAWSNGAMGECAMDDKPLVYSVAQTGLWGEPVRRRKPVITNDYAAPNPLKKGMPEGHVHVDRHMGVPIKDGERIVIVAGVGNKSSDYTDDDVRQMTLLMSGLWTIIRRKRLEDELRRNETRLRSLVDILQYPASTIQELLDYALERAIELTESRIGYIYSYDEERKEFVLNTWSKDVMQECSIVDPQTCYELDKTGIWGEAVRQRKPIIVNDFKADHPLKKGYPEGHANLVKFMTVPVFSGGQIVAVVGVANKDTDYTETDVLQLTLLMDSVWKVAERKKTEAEKEELQAQLLQAKKIESVGQLAGGVAHDFNNMLSVILGHTELALSALEPQHPIYAGLQEIQRAGQHSASLTRQLLAFARKQTIAPKLLDLNETVDGILKMLRRLIGEDIVLEWKPGHGIWPVWMDPTQIDQILANLCVNARDAIAGIGKISIETDNATLDEAYCARHVGVVPGEYALLVISDTGKGMGKDVLDHVFEPFFTTKGVGSGTGLGLATVYGIVRQNDGVIDVHSAPEQGTKFRVYLPKRSMNVAPAKDTGVKHVAYRGSETILLVEDEAAILNLSKRYLESLGYHVLAANSPGEAFELVDLHNGQVDLLITDVVMPEMNGQEVKEQLLARCPDIRCLFMSGYTADVVQLRGVIDEDVNFIQKPFSLHDLSQKVRDILDAI